jgi:hypothetical protein
MSSAEISGTVRKSLWPRRSTIPETSRVNLQAPKGHAEHCALRCNLLALWDAECCRERRDAQPWVQRVDLWERRAPPIDSTISNASKLIMEPICMSLRVLKPVRTRADVTASAAARHALDEPDILRGGPSMESMEQVASFAFQSLLTTFSAQAEAHEQRVFVKRRLQASAGTQLTSSPYTCITS